MSLFSLRHRKRKKKLVSLVCSTQMHFSRMWSPLVHSILFHFLLWCTKRENKCKNKWKFTKARLRTNCRPHMHVRHWWMEIKTLVLTWHCLPHKYYVYNQTLFSQLPSFSHLRPMARLDLEQGHCMTHSRHRLNESAITCPSEWTI